MSEPSKEALELAEACLDGRELRDGIAAAMQKLLDERDGAKQEGDWLRNQKRAYEREFDSAAKRAEAAEAAVLQVVSENEALKRRVHELERDLKTTRGELSDEKEIVRAMREEPSLQDRVAALEAKVADLQAKHIRHHGKF